MSYAIIGFGSIGQALAKAFARNGIDVSIATTRDPDSFAADAAAIGPQITTVTLAQATDADVIFLAVRFESHANVAKALPSWEGKTIIDVTNAFGVSPDDLDGQPSSKFIEQAFTGARLVKGFNHLVAGTLEQDPATHGGHRVVFLASDDARPRPTSQPWPRASASRQFNSAGSQQEDYSSKRAATPGDD